MGDGLDRYPPAVSSTVSKISSIFWGGSGFTKQLQSYYRELLHSPCPVSPTVNPPQPYCQNSNITVVAMLCIEPHTLLVLSLDFSLMAASCLGSNWKPTFRLVLSGLDDFGEYWLCVLKNVLHSRWLCLMFSHNSLGFGEEYHRGEAVSWRCIRGR